MNEESTQFLKMLKYSAITVSGLTVAGIVTLMFLARGTGEDITGIVAPALLIAMVSGVVAIAATVFQRRQRTAFDIKRNDDATS